MKIGQSKTADGYPPAVFFRDQPEVLGFAFDLLGLAHSQGNQSGCGGTSGQRGHDARLILLRDTSRRKRRHHSCRSSGWSWRCRMRVVVVGRLRRIRIRIRIHIRRPTNARRA